MDEARRSSLHVVVATLTEGYARRLQPTEKADLFETLDRLLAPVPAAAMCALADEAVLAHPKFPPSAAALRELWDSWPLEKKARFKPASAGLLPAGDFNVAPTDDPVAHPDAFEVSAANVAAHLLELYEAVVTYQTHLAYKVKTDADVDHLARSWERDCTKREWPALEHGLLVKRLLMGISDLDKRDTQDIKAVLSWIETHPRDRETTWEAYARAAAIGAGLMKPEPDEKGKLRNTWPATVPGYGAKRAFTRALPCEECDQPTMFIYGGVPLCCQHANEKAEAGDLERAAP